nr:tetratricopeptide repeat protein [Gemmatimonadales bacterium]
MAISEIEKLERRFADHPQGLTFAPLAEAMRKQGDVLRALEILKPGLELHPDYIPASIVLGRCHLDQGELGSAEAAFVRVLALDGENVIALKALADITERQGRHEDAERWLRTLLSVDHNNDQARQSLTRLEAALRDTPALESPAAPDEVPALLPADAGAPMGSAIADAPADTLADSAEGHTAEGETAVEREHPEPIELEPAEDSDRGIAWVSDGSEASEVEPLVLEDSTVGFAALTEPVSGLMSTTLPDRSASDGTEAGLAEVDLTEVDLPEDQPDPVHIANGDLLDPDPWQRDAPGPDIQVEKSEDLVLEGNATSEFQVPDASLELSGSQAVPQASEVVRASSRRSGPAPVLDTAAAGDELDDVMDIEPEPVIAESMVTAPIITETMAELLLAQGHKAEARDMFRELARRSGGDERIRQKLAALEDAAPPPPAGPLLRVAYAAPETGGQSVMEFFAGILAARLPSVAASPHADAAGAHAVSDDAAAPTRPAPDALSLSAVFG